MALIADSKNCCLTRYCTLFGSLIVLLGMGFEVKPAATTDPQSGSEPPLASRKPVIAWSIPLQGVVGLAAGDWDLKNTNDVIAASKDGVWTIDSEKGTFKHHFAIAGISSQVLTSIGWTEIKKGQSAAFLCSEGWPLAMPVIGADGARLWSFSSVDAIDSAAWVDLRGSGNKELLIGCNGSGGLHAVDSAGNHLWQNRSVGNVWHVSGIDARDGRPGLALCMGDDIEVFDAAGMKVGQLRHDEYITNFAAAELDTKGLRQVLALCHPAYGRKKTR